MDIPSDLQNHGYVTDPNQPASVDIPLHVAACNGLTETVVELLDQGVPVDQPNFAGTTALHLAILQGHVDIVRLLLARNANVEAPYGPLSSRPVHLATSTLNPAIMEAVLQHKPDLESRTNGLTPLFMAISTGHEGVVRLLLDAGADAKARTTCEPGTGESVLHMAVGWFKNSLLPLLIRHGADVNVAGTNPMGQTALHIAAQYGNTEAMTELIAAGADMYAELPDGCTALEVAAEHGRIKAASLLINCGMDPLAKRFHGRHNAVYVAALHGKTDFVEWFLNRYADRMDRMSKISVVIAAAGTNRIRILQFLDKKGFPMTDPGPGGISALFVARLYKHKDAVIYMLQRGADPDPLIPISNSWANKDPIEKELHDLLQTAKCQRELQPNAELFPEWQYRDEQEHSLPFQAELMALATSVFATKRVEANQDPGGIFCCRECHDLDFRRGMPHDEEIVYFIGMESMQSAASSCRGCRFLLDCLDQVRRAYGEEVWAMLSGKYLVLHSAAQGAPLWLHFHDGNPVSHPLGRIEIYVTEGSGTTWPVVGTGRDVSGQGWGNARVRIAKRFLEECTANHAQCQYTPGKLPTRVIQIPSIGEPRLRISKGKEAKYMTLSHCWGGINPLTTTNATLLQRRREIPFKSLPKTFQDAVTITRSLGVKYLWIDSLCIIQDDRDDWVREAARMKDIYANCYAMISADGSANPNGGCFSSGINEQSRSFAVHSVGPFHSRVTAFVRLTRLRDPFHAEVGHIIGDTTGPLAASQSRSALNRRGWCFQERVLAPRILHLGPSELAWECPETVACECRDVITSHDRESRFKAFFADRILRDAQRPCDNQHAHARQQVNILLWMHFVEEFTRRELTNSTDMLHALSGLAEFMGAATQTDYLCGLWKRNLAELLLWHIDDSDKRIRSLDPTLRTPRPFTVKSPGQLWSQTERASGANTNTGTDTGTGTGTGATLAKRHATYYAPSWSWASVIGPISFQIGRLDTIKRDQFPHVRKDGMLEMAKARHSLLERVDAHYTTDPLNRYGPPKSPASLTIRGPTVLASWTGERDAAHPLARHGGGQILTYIDASPGTASISTADFTLDPLGKETLGISIGAELLLLGTILDDKASVPQENDGAVWGVQIPSVIGIVLARGAPFPTHDLLTDQSAERSVYRRVGLFRANADEWGRIGRMRTVVIM